MTTRKTAPDGLDLLQKRYITGRPEREAMWDAVCVDAEVARTVRAVREKAGLTQRELAKLIGTTASVICRLEDEAYRGHSMAMLHRIAAAMNQRVELRFVPLRKPVRKKRSAA